MIKIKMYYLNVIDDSIQLIDNTIDGAKNEIFNFKSK